MNGMDAMQGTVESTLRQITVYFSQLNVPLIPKNTTLFAFDSAANIYYVGTVDVYPAFIGKWAR